MKFFLIYLLTVNAAGFLLMRGDKLRARKRRWRTPEALLLAAAVLGGSLGTLAGMYLFQHKTRHLKFVLGVPLILLAQLVLIYLFYPFT